MESLNFFNNTEIENYWIVDLWDFLSKELWISESASICCEDGWIITNSNCTSTLYKEIKELQKNKTDYDIYFHKYNEEDFYKSIDRYFEFKLKGILNKKYLLWRIFRTEK